MPKLFTYRLFNNSACKAGFLGMCLFFVKSNAPVIAQCTHSDNFIENSGFEQIIPPCGNIPPSPPYIDAAFNQGCIPGWFAAWGTPSVCNNGPYQGSNYACMGANNEAIFTNLDLCEDNQYNLRFYTKKISGGAGNLLVYLSNGLINLNPGNSGFPPLAIEPDWELLQTVPLSVGGVWIEVNIPLNIPANPVNNQLLFVLSGSLDIGVDEVSIEPCETNLVEELNCSNLGSGSFEFSYELNSSGQAADISSICWFTGDGNIYTDENIQHTFTAEGNYEVCVSLFTEDCCISTFCLEIIYQDCSCTCEPNEEIPLVAEPPEQLIVISCPGPLPEPPTLVAELECGTPEITFEELQTGSACFLLVERTWIVNNPCGTGIIYQQIVEISDTVSPVFTILPQDITADCSDYLPLFNDWISAYGSGAASDNCSLVSWSFEYDSNPEHACASYPVVFIVADSCGNTASHTAIFTTVDNDAPEVIDPPDTSIQVACPNEVPGIPQLLTSDNCSAQIFTFFNEETNGSSCDYVITRSWILEDYCLNLSFFEQTISVSDNEPPIILTLPSNKTANCSDSLTAEFLTWVAQQGGAAAADNCSNVSWNAIFDGLPENRCEVIEVVFIASDECGNFASSTARFIIEDEEPPVWDAPPENFVIYCSDNPGERLINWIETNGGFSASDNCGIVTLSNDFDGDTSLIDREVIFIASDECGNSISAVVHVTQIATPDTTSVQLFTCDPLEVGSDTVVWVNDPCDSIVVLTYILESRDTIFQEIKVCDESEVRSDTIQIILPDGCDSITVQSFVFYGLPVTMLENRSCEITDFSIDTIVLQGQYCDSLILIQNIPLPSDTVYLVNNTCDSSQEGIDTSYYINRYFCDSLVISENILQLSDTTYIRNFICDSLLTGIEVVDFINQFGCDSIVYIERIYSEYAINEQTIIVCEKGVNYADSVWLQGALCDNLVITNYIFAASDTTVILEEICNPDETGEVIIIFQNQFNCDSVIVINYFFEPIDTLFISMFTCDQNSEGLVINVFTGFNGCDSVIVEEYVFIESDTTLIKTFDCFTDKISIDTILLRNQGGCDSLVITEFIPAEKLTRFSLGPDRIVSEGDSLVLNLVIEGNISEIVWEPAVLFSCTGCIEQVIMPSASSWIYVRVLDESGCEYIDSIYVRVLATDGVFIPGAFTPDGDGINDIFTVYGNARLAKIRTMQLFDRWGNKIYEGKEMVPGSESAGWSGEFRGRPMDPGSFAYLIEVEFQDGSTKIYSGEVMLIR